MAAEDAFKAINGENDFLIDEKNHEPSQILRSKSEFCLNEYLVATPELKAGFEENNLRLRDSIIITE